MDITLTEKNTKPQILEAYRKALSALEARDAQRSDVRDERERADQTIAAASGMDAKTITANLQQLGERLTAEIDRFSAALTDEQKRFADLRQATDVQRERLEQANGMTVAARSLEALQLTHDEYKDQLQRDRQRLEADRAREQEEYKYRIALERKRDSDAYEAKQSALEEDLKRRKEEIAKQETDMAALRKRAESFDAEVRAASEKAAAETEQRVRREDQIAADLLAERTQGERKLLVARIETLEAHAAELKAENAGLRQQATALSQEARDIAVKVIEGSANAQNMKSMQNIALEQARGGGRREP
ncbi:hypothetical protein HY213_04580 [Candidatus Peregrinibacteria bacterium]|nr:hypothetical protein [Candidatus Peregrinibacteria bacterium]